MSETARIASPENEETGRAYSKRTKRAARAAGLIAAAALVVGMVPASSASASALACQDASVQAVLENVPGGFPSSAVFRCSGSHNPGMHGAVFRSNGWTGAVYTTGGRTIFFCKWQVKEINAQVREVYLNAAVPGRCLF
jgi:hypothetical protein